MFVAAAAAAGCRPGTCFDIVDIENVAAADAFLVAFVVPVEVVVDFATVCAAVEYGACNMIAAFELEETKDDSSSFRFAAVAAAAIKHSKMPMDRSLACLD